MAIARDSSTFDEQTGTSATVSHTVSGSDTVLFVGFSTSSTSGDIATGVTYNAVSMTQVVKVDTVITGRFTYIYGLLNPATGANDVVISISESKTIRSASVSYTGVDQGQTLTDITDTDQAGTGTTTTINMTTTSDNSWGFMVVKADNGTIAAGSGTTLIGVTSGTSVGAFEKDFGTSGAETMNATQNGNGNTNAVSVAFTPAVAAGPATLKTWNTVTAANVKTVDTVAIANIKTIDTIV